MCLSTCSAGKCVSLLALLAGVSLYLLGWQVCLSTCSAGRCVSLLALLAGVSLYMLWWQVCLSLRALLAGVSLYMLGWQVSLYMLGWQVCLFLLSALAWDPFSLSPIHSVVLASSSTERLLMINERLCFLGGKILLKISSLIFIGGIGTSNLSLKEKGHNIFIAMVMRFRRFSSLWQFNQLFFLCLHYS